MSQDYATAVTKSYFSNIYLPILVSNPDIAETIIFLPPHFLHYLDQ